VNVVEAALRGIAKDLADLHVDWALIGGFAVSIRAETRLEVIPGLVLPVGSVAGLIVTKLLAQDDSSRPQDSIDLLGLTAVAQAADLVKARGLARLVEERGYQRGRDLVAAVARLPTAHG
jgi:hypothetical protein